MQNQHLGHRARLRQRAATEGIENFEPHELVELLLYPVLPLRDINPMAHQLTERFSTVEGVCFAPAEQLARVEGIGENSARWLNLLGQVADAYALQAFSPYPAVDTFRRMTDYCLELFRHVRQEQTWVFCLSTSGQLTARVLLCPDSSPGNVSERSVAQAIIGCRSTHAVLVQWRQPGRLAFGRREMETAARLAEYLPLLEAQLVDSILVSRNTALSLRQQQMMQPPDQPRILMAEPGPALRNWLE